MSTIIDEIEKTQLKQDIPEFGPGDTIVVQVKVKEGNRERLQAFEGVVIAKRNRGMNSGFTVRKISHGEGVERVFQTHSPLVHSIEVKRRGDVRRAKLYYLRDRSGRSARIKEKVTKISKESTGKKTTKVKAKVATTETEATEKKTTKKTTAKKATAKKTTKKKATTKTKKKTD